MHHQEHAVNQEALIDSEPTYRALRHKVHRMIDEMCGRVVADESSVTVSTPAVSRPARDEPESAVDQLNSLYLLVGGPSGTSSMTDAAATGGLVSGMNTFQQYRHLRTILTAYPELVSQEVQMLRAWNEEQKNKISELEKSLRVKNLELEKLHTTLTRSKADIQSFLNERRRHSAQVADFEKQIQSLHVRPRSADTRAVASSAGTAAVSTGTELLELRKKVGKLEMENVELRKKLGTSRPTTATSTRPRTAVTEPASVRTIVVREEPSVGVSGKDLLALQELPLLQRKVAKLDASLTEAVAKTRQREREIFSRDMQLRDARNLVKKLAKELEENRKQLDDANRRLGEIIKSRNSMS